MAFAMAEHLFPGGASFVVEPLNFEGFLEGTFYDKDSFVRRGDGMS